MRVWLVDQDPKSQTLGTRTWPPEGSNSAQMVFCKEQILCGLKKVLVQIAAFLEGFSAILHRKWCTKSEDVANKVALLH